MPYQHWKIVGNCTFMRFWTPEDHYGPVSLVVTETTAIGDPQELPSGSGAGGGGSAAATWVPDTPRAGQRPLRRQGPLNLDGT